MVSTNLLHGLFIITRNNRLREIFRLSIVCVFSFQVLLRNVAGVSTVFVESRQDEAEDRNYMRLGNGLVKIKKNLKEKKRITKNLTITLAQLYKIIHKSLCMATMFADVTIP